MMDFTGTVFGSYKLLELIGSGGFAKVYKGVHIWLGTPVAVKVLNIRVHPGDKEAVRRSLQEALIANSLKHRHVIPILDCNIQNGVPYIVMPYIKNGSLARVYGQHGRLRWDTLMGNVHQVAEALTFIHSCDLIHQDVKPENMLLGDDGTILLSDFGTVAFIEGTGAHYPETLIGSVSYMAPERFTGGMQTPASHVYSLGIVVYKWLTGSLPFTGTTREIIRKHLHAPLPTRLLTTVGIDSAIQGVLLKALAKNPRHRYQSTLEFYEALKNAKEAAAQPQGILPQRRNRPNRLRSRWMEMSIVFTTSVLTSLLLSAVCSLRGVQIETDVLIWLVCLSMLPLLGALIRKNWLALRFVFASFIVAGISSLLTQSWPILCLALPGSLLASAIIGLLIGNLRMSTIAV